MTPGQMAKILELADDSEIFKARATFIRKRIDELAEAMERQKYIDAAELRVKEAQEALMAIRGGVSVTEKKSTATTPERKKYLDEIRDWAHNNGHYLKPRGRIPRDIEEMFHRDQKKSHV